MKLMHTKTPDFVQKMHNAAFKGGKTLVMKGMETVRSGKWASIKTGQIEEITGVTAQEEVRIDAVAELAEPEYSEVVK